MGTSLVSGSGLLSETTETGIAEDSRILATLDWGLHVDVDSQLVDGSLGCLVVAVANEGMGGIA